MAKIFRTEELSIGADNIRLTASSDGSFSFKKADGTELLSNTSMDSEFTSLNNKLDGIVSDRKDGISDSDSDLGVASQARTDDIDAKDVQLSTAITARTNEITSLNTKLEGFASDRVDAISGSNSDLGVAVDFRTGNVNSLANMIGEEDVYAARYSLNGYQGEETFTANWDGDFLPQTDPVVCAMLRGTNSSDPMLGVMISGAQTDLKTGAHFAFSDKLPNNNYELEILVSKAP